MTLNTQEISALLPHRYPFLLVDRVLDLTPGKHCQAIKNVTVNEPFFPGHFPTQPVMPGVLILESLAQTGALILYSLPENEQKILYLAGADDVRFKKPVVPGDVLVNDVHLLWYRRGFGRIKCTASVNDEVVAEAEMSFSLTARY
ncbi:MAG: beta-hydroxyacyl-(acyl-carrier-protein) dehydratase FabZ [Armatimonadetes bacterium]|jgi:3-hydroxyacyl-[acyl-carrier-protein] dehydratase|nr:beta-hydroxyacyl-(acyl-carrier-protein) dehydratase FabZ [Armatimonadota bacterium]